MLLAFWPCRSGGRIISYTHKQGGMWTYYHAFTFFFLCLWTQLSFRSPTTDTHTHTHRVSLCIHIFRNACLLLSDNVALKAWLYESVGKSFLLSQTCYTHGLNTCAHGIICICMFSIPLLPKLIKNIGEVCVRSPLDLLNLTLLNVNLFKVSEKGLVEVSLNTKALWCKQSTKCREFQLWPCRMEGF